MNKPQSAVSVNRDLIMHWQNIRKLAIEMGAHAENNLVEMGAMKPENRAIITRNQRRAIKWGDGRPQVNSRE